MYLLLLLFYCIFLQYALIVILPLKNNIYYDYKYNFITKTQKGIHIFSFFESFIDIQMSRKNKVKQNNSIEKDKMDFSLSSRFFFSLSHFRFIAEIQISLFKEYYFKYLTNFLIILFQYIYQNKYFNLPFSNVFIPLLFSYINRKLQKLLMLVIRPWSFSFFFLVF